MTRLEEMDCIQEQKDKDINAQELIPLNGEGKALAEGKRQTFDMPINVAKVDPLR